MKQKHLSDLQLLKEIAELLNRGTELNNVLLEVLKKLLYITGLETGWIFFIEESGAYQLAAKYNLPHALSTDHFRPMCQGDCWCVDRYAKGRLDKATNIIECKRIEDIIEAKQADTGGLTHHATVPLKAGDEKFGLLNVGSPYKKSFNHEELALLESVSLQIGTFIKRIKLTQKEQEMALSAERNRLARDLHDSVNQLLFSLSLTARGGKEMVNDHEVRETFSYIQDLAQVALNEMRALIWQLKPRGLEKGIVCALSNYGEMLGLHVDVKINGVLNLSNSIEEVLWRIGQEAMANCKKHSGQSQIQLEFWVGKKEVNVCFKDKGCGFNYDPSAELFSLGLKSMEERLKAVGGTLEIQSSIGKGTMLLVTIPF